MSSKNSEKKEPVPKTPDTQGFWEILRNVVTHSRMREDGNVPKNRNNNVPRAKPNRKTLQFYVRPQMHAQVKIRAIEEGLTIQEFLIEAVTDKLQGAIASVGEDSEIKARAILNALFSRQRMLTKMEISILCGLLEGAPDFQKIEAIVRHLKHHQQSTPNAKC